MAKYQKVVSLSQITQKPTKITQFVSLWIEEPDEENDAFTIHGRNADKRLEIICDFPEDFELACMFCAAHLAYTMGIPVENWPDGANMSVLNSQLYMANNNTGSIQ